MPMDVSSLLPVRLLMYPIKRAMATPAGTATISALPVTSKPTPMPGSMECARASPMNARPRATT